MDGGTSKYDCRCHLHIGPSGHVMISVSMVGCSWYGVRRRLSVAGLFNSLRLEEEGKRDKYRRKTIVRIPYLIVIPKKKKKIKEQQISVQ